MKCFEVLYGDTDSVFVYRKGLALELSELVSLGQKLAEEFNSTFRKILSRVAGIPSKWIRINLELDKIWETIYFTSVKKRYLGKVVYDGAILSQPKFVVTGFEIKHRGNRPVLYREVLRDIVETYFMKGSEACRKVAKKYYEDLMSGKLDDKLVIKVNIEKHPMEAKINSPAYRAARLAHKLWGFEGGFLLFVFTYKRGNDYRVLPLRDLKELEKVRSKIHPSVRKELWNAMMKWLKERLPFIYKEVNSAIGGGLTKWFS